MSDIYVARESFATQLDGARVVVRKGTTRVRAGHPLLQRNPGAFELVDNAPVNYEVEQATAAPAEKRGPGRPRKNAE